MLNPRRHPRIGFVSQLQLIHHVAGKAFEERYFRIPNTGNDSDLIDAGMDKLTHLRSHLICRSGKSKSVHPLVANQILMLRTHRCRNVL
jgi:hypothetical protein